MFTVNQQTNTNIGGVGGSFSSGSSFGAPQGESKAPLVFVFGFLILDVVFGMLTGYAYYLRSDFEKKNAERQTDLAKVTVAQEITIQEMQDFTGRVKAFSSIFNNAPSAYSLFTVVEHSVVRGVYFKDMTATRIEGTRTYKVIVTGTANTFQDLISQRDVFRSKSFSGYVSDANVSTYDLDLEEGGVKFTINLLITVGRFSATNLLIDLTTPEEGVVQNASTEPTFSSGPSTSSSTEIGESVSTEINSM